MFSFSSTHTHTHPYIHRHSYNYILLRGYKNACACATQTRINNLFDEFSYVRGTAQCTTTTSTSAAYATKTKIAARRPRVFRSLRSLRYALRVHSRSVSIATPVVEPVRKNLLFDVDSNISKFSRCPTAAISHQAASYDQPFFNTIH